MRLIGTRSSPFTRKVRIFAIEKQLDLPFVVDSPLNSSSGVAALNPLGKVPVLVRDGGEPLIDSSLIVEFIESLYADPVLIPAEPAARTAVRQWEAIADGVLDAAVLIRMEQLRPQPERSAAWISRQRGKIERGLAHLEHAVQGREFCSGQTLTLADIALGCCMGYLQFRFPAEGWAGRFCALASMANRFEQRASFVDTPMGD